MDNPVRSPFDRTFDAFLFDMDGTILSSIVAAERIWADWARRHGVEVATFLPTIHGVRTIETIRRLALPGVDAEREATLITDAEIADVTGIDEIAGAARFLASLPSARWAVVTSAPRRLAERRLAAAGLPTPPLMVTSEDVERGKPAPDCFLLAAARLGARAADCLVFEDAPAGVEAAERAEATVVVITATHTHVRPTRHHAVAGYDRLAARQDASGKLELVSNAD